MLFDNKKGESVRFIVMQHYHCHRVLVNYITHHSDGYTSFRFYNPHDLTIKSQFTWRKSITVYSIIINNIYLSSQICSMAKKEISIYKINAVLIILYNVIQI